MIDYDNDNYSMVMTCDGYDCTEHLELTGEFVECIQEAKDEEWHTHKNEDEEWEHYCPRCWATKGAKGVFE